MKKGNFFANFQPENLRSALQNTTTAVSSGLQNITGEAGSGSEQGESSTSQKQSGQQKETGSQQVYVSSSPQEFVKVPRSSFERVKYWYKGDLNALVQTNAEDKEALLTENEKLRAALGSRISARERIDDILPDKGIAVQRVRETEDGVNRLLLSSATRELEQLRTKNGELVRKLEESQQELRDLRMRQVSEPGSAESPLPLSSSAEARGDEGERATSAEHEHESLRDQIEQLRSELQESEKHRNHLEQELARERERAEHSNLSNEKQQQEEMSQEIAEVKKDRDAAHSRAESERLEKEKAEERLKEMREQKEGKESELSRLEQQLHQLQNVEPSAPPGSATCMPFPSQPTDEEKELLRAEERRRKAAEEALEQFRQASLQEDVDAQGQTSQGSSQSLDASERFALPRHLSSKSLESKIGSKNDKMSCVSREELEEARQVMANAVGKREGRVGHLILEFVDGMQNRVAKAKERSRKYPSSSGNRMLSSKQLEEGSRLLESAVDKLGNAALEEIERKEEEIKDARWQARELEGAAEERERAEEEAGRAKEKAEQAAVLEGKLREAEHELERQKEKVRKAEDEAKRERQASESARTELEDMKRRWSSRLEKSCQADIVDEHSELERERQRLKEEYDNYLRHLTSQEEEARGEVERWRERYEAVKDDFSKWRERALSMMESKDKEIANLKKRAMPVETATHGTHDRDNSPTGAASVQRPHPFARLAESEDDEAPVKRVDLVYLRNVVAKFAETTDWSTQEYLISVIGTLLEFDKATMDRIRNSRKSYLPMKLHFPGFSR